MSYQLERDLYGLKNSILKRRSLLGYVLIISAAAFAGLLEVAGKPLVDTATEVDDLNPIMLSFAIYLVIGLFFTPFARKKQKNKTPFKISRKNLILICLIGVAEISAVTFNFFGLQETSVVNSSIIGNSEILFGAMLAFVFFKEKLQKNEYFPVLILILGTMALPIASDFYYSDSTLTTVVFGDVLILIGALFYGLDMNLCKLVNERIPSSRISQISAFSGCAFALTIGVLLGLEFNFKLEHLPNILFMGIFATGLSSFFFIIALRLIGAMKSILLYSTTTIFGVVFAWVLLGEPVNTINIISICVAGLGIFMLRNHLAQKEE